MRCAIETSKWPPASCWRARGWRAPGHLPTKHVVAVQPAWLRNWGNLGKSLASPSARSRAGERFRKRTRVVITERGADAVNRVCPDPLRRRSACKRGARVIVREASVVTQADSASALLRQLQDRAASTACGYAAKDAAQPCVDLRVEGTGLDSRIVELLGVAAHAVCDLVHLLRFYRTDVRILEFPNSRHTTFVGAPAARSSGALRRQPSSTMRAARALPCVGCAGTQVPSAFREHLGTHAATPRALCPAFRSPMVLVSTS